jgi:hypothetical protein
LLPVDGLLGFFLVLQLACRPHGHDVALVVLGGRLPDRLLEGREQCQPITGGERAVSANHRRGESSVSQSQEGREQCPPITGGETAVSANHKRGKNRAHQPRLTYIIIIIMIILLKVLVLLSLVHLLRFFFLSFFIEWAFFY